MCAEDAGGPCLFELTLGGLRLFECSFGCRACLPNEEFLHSYVGEALALRYGVQKNPHQCHGRPFTNIGDCVSIRWIMFYSGNNPVIKRIQLELMGWWMTIVHRPRRMNIPPDYFSKMGTEFHFDPLLDQYRKIAEENKKSSPPTATGSIILGKNLPKLCGIRQRTNPPAQAAESCHLAMASYETLSNATLTVIPVSFGQAAPGKPSKTLNQSACGLAAFQLLQQSWVIYGFTSGHFFTSCKSVCENITVHLAADTNERGRSFLKTFGKVNTVVSSAIELLQQIRTMNYTLPTQGYFISGQYTLDKTRQLDFLKVQSTIIDELRSRNQMQTFILHLPPPYQRTVIKQFEKSLTNWSITSKFVEYTAFGDCIDDISTILIGIHSGITGAPIEVSIIRPPQIPTCIEDNIYKPFDDDTFVMSHHPVASEEEADDDKFEIKPLSPTPASPLSSIIKYHLIRKGDHPAALVGTNVYSRSGTAPPLNPYNFNPFH
jgi:hypothetical protein